MEFDERYQRHDSLCINEHQVVRNIKVTSEKLRCHPRLARATDLLWISAAEQARPLCQVAADQSAARRSERKLVLEGDRLIADALASGGRPTLALYSPEKADYQVIARLQEFDCDLLPVSAEVLAFASDTQQPAGIVAVFAIPKPPIPRPASRALILDADSRTRQSGRHLENSGRGRR